MPKAITAKAHKLTRIIYSMLKLGQRYVDAGSEYYERQYRQRALGNAKRRPLSWDTSWCRYQMAGTSRQRCLSHMLWRLFDIAVTGKLRWNSNRYDGNRPTVGG